MTIRTFTAWILFHRDGKKYIAHKSSASPAGTRFIPLFKTRREAIEYRGLRLMMPSLQVKRVTIGEIELEMPLSTSKGSGKRLKTIEETRL